MSKRKRRLITEFLIEVGPRGISFNGFDDFLWWLIHRKPKEGFSPYAWKINRLKRCSR